MAIITLNEALSFCGVDQDFFTVNAGQDLLIMKRDGGSSTNISLTSDTYTGDELAAHIVSRMNTLLSVADSTCTFSSSTRKFTIGTGAGHTIQVIVSGADASVLCGFTANSSVAQTVTSDTTVGSDPTSLVNTIKLGAEAYIKKYCRRTLEASQSYTNERYNGNGKRFLVLKHFPITAFTKLAIGILDVIRVRNTNANTIASVSVTSSGINLERNGTTDSTVTFASNTTLSAIVTAISVISGWEASIESSDYNSYVSTELIQISGLNAIDNNWIYLAVTDDAEDEFDVDFDRGVIYLPYNFPVGTRNIFVTYSAYSAIADDLKLAALILTKNWYQKRQEETYGLTNYSVGDVKATFDKLGIPIQAKLILDQYKRVLI